jgi:hypothetical protein
MINHRFSNNVRVITVQQTPSCAGRTQVTIDRPWAAPRQYAPNAASLERITRLVETVGPRLSFQKNAICVEAWIWEPIDIPDYFIPL